MRLLSICLALAMPGLASAADVEVRISLSAPGALEVSYVLPAGCVRLPFEKSGDAYQTIRATWQSQEACGAADGGALSRSGDACPLRFRVPASTDKVAGYPGAFPIGEAIYAHTSKYAVTAACGSVSYHFVAPGSVGLQGKIHHASASVDGAAGGDLAVLLMPRDLPPSDTAYFDPALSAESVAQIKATADGTIAFLKKALPDSRFNMPIMAAGLAIEPGGPNVGGDAADIMRFTFFNWPRQPQPELQRKMRLLVAHEMSHRFQMRDAVDAYPEARLIHEGGGEFLRWVVSVKQGWLTHAQAATELDEKLAICMLGTGQRSWGELTRREIAVNAYDYACGLPAYVYALAARQGSGNPLSRINDFYKNVRLGAAPGFEHALECGGNASCQPRWLPQLLGKAVPMTGAWNDLMTTTGLARLAAPTQFELDAMMKNALVQLVKDDCGGDSSTTPTPEGMIVDSLKACKALRKEAYVTQVEGLPVFGAAQALPAMVAACASRAEVKLGMKNGETLAVPCQRAYAARTQFYKVDIERVLASLDRG